MQRSPRNWASQGSPSCPALCQASTSSLQWRKGRGWSGRSPAMTEARTWNQCSSTLTRSFFCSCRIALLGYFVLGRLGNLAPVIWLALASLAFYSVSNWQFVALLLASIAFNYVVGWLLISKQSAPRPAICGADGRGRRGSLVLGYFKYAGFLAANLNALFSTGLTVEHSAPGGHLFYTFTQIAFLVDAYRGKVAHYALPHYALFVSYFPHLIAGPILHHRDMIPQFERAEFKAAGSASDPVRPDHFRDRPVQEDLPCRWHPAAGRARLRPGAAVVRSGLDRRAGLYLPALFRFLRLFRHGDRNVADVRHFPAAQFQFALQGARASSISGAAGT